MAHWLMFTETSVQNYVHIAETLAKFIVLLISIPSCIENLQFKTIF